MGYFVFCRIRSNINEICQVTKRILNYFLLFNTKYIWENTYHINDIGTRRKKRYVNVQVEHNKENLDFLKRNVKNIMFNRSIFKRIEKNYFSTSKMEVKISYKKRSIL